MNPKQLFPLIFTVSSSFWTVFCDNTTSKQIFINTNITDDPKVYLSSQWLTKFVPSVYTLVFIVALPLNVLAIIIFLFKIHVKKPAVVYMLNLAAADVLFVILLPFDFTYRFSGNNWLIGDGMCRYVTAAFYCNMYCSILLMTSMTVDRFLAVVYPMQSLSWRTMSRAWLVCLFIWIISIASTVPLLMSEQAQYIPSLGITTCHDELDLQNFNLYYLITFSSIFFLPLVITIVCYIGIIRALSSRNIGHSNKKRRAVVLAIIMLSVYIICFGPTNVIFVMHYLHFTIGYDVSFNFAYILCGCVSSISFCLDPLMYCYASSKCRMYAYSLLCCKKTEKLQAKQKELSTKSTSI